MVGETIRVLLVDDNTQYRTRLVKALRLQPGIEVIGEAASGREGVQLARSLRPDVMLMDFRMAGLDGFSAAGAIMRDVPGTKIFILTAYAGALDVAKVGERGLQGLLIKDQPVSEIVEAIRRSAVPAG